MRLNFQRPYSPYQRSVNVLNCSACRVTVVGLLFCLLTMIWQIHKTERVNQSNASQVPTNKKEDLRLNSSSSKNERKKGTISVSNDYTCVSETNRIRTTHRLCEQSCLCNNQLRFRNLQNQIRTVHCDILRVNVSLISVYANCTPSVNEWNLESRICCIFCFA